MTDYPGVHRKAPGRGWIYRWRETDPTTGKAVKHTSAEFSSAMKAAADRSRNRARLKLAHVALRNPTREGQTIEGAWRLHPSTVREPAARTKKYAKMLAAFTNHVGYTELRRLTYADVSAWVTVLRDRKLAWSTRCHYLTPLRRATKMAPTLGLPDVLAMLNIDERPDDQHAVQAWTFDQIVQAYRALSGNLRARVALALGAFVGLRPSEIYRLRCGYLDADGRLSIGIQRGAGVATVKNRPSRRLLPLPAPVLHDVKSLIGTRSPNDYLIATARGKQFNDVTFAEWLGPILEQKTKRDLSPKYLRKTFATWTLSAGFDFIDIETYLGRETPLTASITGRHYLADYYLLISRRLDPLCAKITSKLTTEIGGHFGGHKDAPAPIGPPIPPTNPSEQSQIAIR